VTGFFNRDEKCLQRGTDWVFKYSGLRFVFKGLMVSPDFFCMGLRYNNKLLLLLLLLYFYGDKAAQPGG
jgi:hypothetical protein